jgi:hypothetical protein
MHSDGRWVPNAFLLLLSSNKPIVSRRNEHRLYIFCLLQKRIWENAGSILTLVRLLSFHTETTDRAFMHVIRLRVGKALRNKFWNLSLSVICSARLLIHLAFVFIHLVLQGDTVDLGTMLQAARSRVRCLMMSFQPCYGPCVDWTPLKAQWLLYCDVLGW